MAEICVFCSSHDVDGKYRKFAEEMGRLLGLGGYDLVYGGTNLGLMGVLANSVRESGGNVRGVVPRVFEHNLGPEHERVIVENLAERKAFMMKKSDAFVGIAGGFGTLDEILEVIALKIVYKNEMDKPMIILNQERFYDGMLNQFEKMYKEGFANKKDLYEVAETPEKVMELLKYHKL